MYYKILASTFLLSLMPSSILQTFTIRNKTPYTITNGYLEIGEGVATFPNFGKMIPGASITIEQSELGTTNPYFKNLKSLNPPIASMSLYVEGVGPTSPHLSRSILMSHLTPDITLDIETTGQDFSVHVIEKKSSSSGSAPKTSAAAPTHVASLTQSSTSTDTSSSLEARVESLERDIRMLESKIKK